MAGTDDVICNCLAVRQAARQLTQLYDEALADSGIRVTQYSILARLSRIEPATMQQLAETLVMDRTTLTHNLKPLERDGLVAIGVDANDQRARRLRVTSAGRKTLTAARAAWRRAQDRFEERFGTADAARLRRDLARVVDATR